MDDCRLSIDGWRLTALVFQSAFGNRQSAMATLGWGKRIDDFQPGKPAEVAVTCDDLRNAVLQAKGDDVSDVNQIARGACLAKDLVEHGSVPWRFGKQKERR